jgi:hypothetical protein
MERKAIYIPKGFHGELKSYAAKRGVSLEYVVMMLVAFGMKHIEDAMNKRFEKSVRQMIVEGL